MDEAVQHTLRVMERRSRWFRNMVIAVVMIPVASGVWALVAGSWLPLLGLLVLVPVCVLFLLLDVRALQQWQRYLFARWQDGSIKLDVFAHAIDAMPKLPKHTLKAMLDTLPTQDLDARIRQPSATTREALIATVEAISRYEIARQAWILGGVVVALVSVIGAVVQMVWLPLAGLLVPGLLLLLWHRYQQRGRHHLKTRMQSLVDEPDFEPDIYRARTARLDATALAPTDEPISSWVIDETVIQAL
ncbi:MAG TPA: hypothetical protein VKP65_09410 [Rhodothermales bacterium]|nr:hypothetical protein [Rhodothermales bacterium]